MLRRVALGQQGDPAEHRLAGAGLEVDPGSGDLLPPLLLGAGAHLGEVGPEGVRVDLEHVQAQVAVRTPLLGQDAVHLDGQRCGVVERGASGLDGVRRCAAVLRHGSSCVVRRRAGPGSAEDPGPAG